MKMTFANNRTVEIQVYSRSVLRVAVNREDGGNTVLYLDQADARVLAVALKEQAAQLRVKK